MKKTILIFLLMIAAAFQVFAGTDDDMGESKQTEPDEQVDIIRTMPPPQDFDNSKNTGDNYTDARLTDMRNEIADLRREIEDLRREIDNLKPESRENSGTWDDSFPGPAPQTNAWLSQTGSNNKSGEQPEPGNGSGSAGKLKPVLGVMIFVLAALLIICIVLFIYSKLQSTVKKHHDLPEEKPERPTRESLQAQNSYLLHRQPGVSRTFGNAGTSSGFSAQSPAAGPAAAPKPPADEISPLYRSAERREKRHNNDPGDVFLDVKKSVLERLIQGEKIPPVLEKGGTRLSAQFVLVNNKYLYPNFHIYNETKELSNKNGNDKVMSMIYDLKREDLPGFVERCRPAMVSPRDDAFTVAVRGSLKTGPLGVI
ncbi:MAG: hypothetical protein LBB83_12320 [Treponema sp.]|jgi:cell division protein FtsL|nr:hypothetical protein [Treponema sp.]